LTQDHALTDPGPIGALDNLWGVKVVTNTMAPVGTPVIFDTVLVVRAFVRWGLEVEHWHSCGRVEHRATTQPRCGYCGGTPPECCWPMYQRSR
jgi:hypothetical protein